MNIRVKGLLLCLLLSFYGGITSAQLVITSTPTHSPVPGGIAIVDIPVSQVNPEQAPAVYFQDNRVMVIAKQGNNGNRWQAIIGIPLQIEPGEHQASIREASTDTAITFRIESKSYNKQYITLKNKRQVNPYAKDLVRINRETNEIINAYKHWNSDRPPITRLDMPVSGKLSSPFGLRRYFNNEPRKPHSGIDIAAPEGTAVIAPANGSVLTTGDYFFNGNTVILDHGHGLITLYCHLQKISVKPGDSVEQGQTIGTLGMTGRVTGPHLHWSVSLNNARIDPGLLLQSPAGR